ncbi:MAG: class I SAM-dependent DNA methyltransferase [Burkholderiales bacterium]|nr:class I SAM-dependent DNA methyltransferase [Burkholderiales bacterium]
MDKSVSSLIWDVAEILRGDYKQNEYGSIILPFTILRRLDCLLEDTRDKVHEKWLLIDKSNQKARATDPNTEMSKIAIDRTLNREAALPFHNKSNNSFQKMQGNSAGIAKDLRNYVNNFSSNVSEIFVKFKFLEKIDELNDKNLLFQVVKKFNAINLHPNSIDGYSMGLLYEELLRKFAEMSNETAGEHFTPREIVNLMINILFAPDDQILRDKGATKSIYDPTCGTGGMLVLAEEYLKEKSVKADPVLFGQELNDETYAMCKASILIKGKDRNKIANGNTLSNDAYPNEQFDYMLANPPYGVDWNKIKTKITDEHSGLLFNGRFGAGVPRVSDGQLLFVQHLLSKMKSVDNQNNGSRIGIVLNGSPLFTGGAGSGESNIRKWIIENDYLDALIALPNDMFFNTGIATYIWILSNRKSDERKGKVQLINATAMYQKMRKSLGSKRNELSEEHIKTITDMYSNFKESEICKIFENHQFGYTNITVERPLRMSYTITEHSINVIKQDKAFIKLESSTHENICQILAELLNSTYLCRKDFINLLNSKTKLKDAWLKIILKACGERNPDGEVCLDSKGNPEPDSELRDSENIPLLSLDYDSAEQKSNIQDYFDKEVLPHLPDAWIDWSKNKVGFEISFNRYFYKYAPPRDLHEIDIELKQLSGEIQQLLNEVCGI